MFYRTKTEALLNGLRRIGRDVDPEQIEKRAKEAGIRLPVTCVHVTAASFNHGMGGMGWSIDSDALGELGPIVDRLMATRRAT